MNTVYTFVILSGLLTVLLWAPYILARLFVWGLPTFLNNYPENFPASAPEPPLWAQRAQRAHLNMVETLPAFLAVVAGAIAINGEAAAGYLALWTQVFFYARIAHAIVYMGGIPYLRTPVYLVSWAAILAIGVITLTH